MSRVRNTAGRLALLLLTLMLATGILAIYQLRMARGDAFPIHSSLRADPMGTRLLYEAIQEAGLADTTRNFTPLDKLPLPDAPTTLLLVGTEMAISPDIDWTPRPIANQLSRFAANGGNIVIALHPSFKLARRTCESNACDAVTNTVEEVDADATNTVDNTEAEAPAPPINGCQRCGHDHTENMRTNNVDTATWIGATVIHELRTSPAGDARRAPDAPSHLPATLPCKTDAVLHDLSPTWQVVYARDDLPVIARRSYGKGTFTLSTLSYLLTNQALRDDRRTGAILWLLGDAEEVIFDETHLGLASQRLTAELLRQHRLQWVLAVAALAGLLFAWRAGSSLLPKRHDDPLTQLTDASETTQTSLLALLRRHLPPRQILSSLVEQWEEHGDAGSVPCQPVLTRARHIAAQEAATKTHSSKKILTAHNELVREAQAARHSTHRLTSLRDTLDTDNPISE